MRVSQTVWITFVVLFLSGILLNESNASDSSQDFICFLKPEEETFGSNPTFLFSKDEVFVLRNDKLVRSQSPDDEIADIGTVGDIKDVYSARDNKAVVLRTKNGVYLAPNIPLYPSDEPGHYFFRRAEYTKLGVLFIYDEEIYALTRDPVRLKPLGIGSISAPTFFSDLDKKWGVIVTTGDGRTMRVTKSNGDWLVKEITHNGQSIGSAKGIVDANNRGLIITTSKSEVYRIAEPDGEIVKLDDPIDSMELTLNTYLIGNQVLISTKNDVYLLDDHDQIEPLREQEIGMARKLIIYHNEGIAVIASDKGLFTWDKQNGVKEIDMMTEGVDEIIKSRRGLFIRSNGTYYFLAHDQLAGQPNIQALADAKYGETLDYEIKDVKDWHDKTLVVTDKSVFILSDGDDGLISINIPGLPFGDVDDSYLEFRSSNGHLMLRHDNALYFVKKDTLPSDEELVVDEFNEGKQNSTLRWHINTERHPCIQTERTLQQSVYLVTGDNKRVPTKNLSIQLLSDTSDVNKLDYLASFDRPGDPVKKVVFRIKALEAKRDYENDISTPSIVDFVLNSWGIIIGIAVPSLYLILLFCARYWNWAFRLLLNEEWKYVNIFRLLVIYVPFFRRWVLARYFLEMKAKLDERDKDDSEISKRINVMLEDKNGTKVHSRDMLSLLANYNQVLVIGDEGTGKTRLTHALEQVYASERSFWQAWRRYKFIPIFIYAKNYPNPEDTKNWIVELAQREFKTLKIEIRDLDYFQRILESGDFAIFLDGLDEVDVQHTEDALGYCGDTATVRDFITTRPLDENIRYKKDLFKEFYIAD